MTAFAFVAKVRKPVHAVVRPTRRRTGLRDVGHVAALETLRNVALFKVPPLGHDSRAVRCRAWPALAEPRSVETAMLHASRV
jgi:hypothetical protein